MSYSRDHKTLHKLHPLCLKSQKHIKSMILLGFKLMTRRPGAAENLFIGLGQPVKEAAERAFGF